MNTSNSSRHEESDSELEEKEAASTIQGQVPSSKETVRGDSSGVDCLVHSLLSLKRQQADDL